MLLYLYCVFVWCIAELCGLQPNAFTSFMLNVFVSCSSQNRIHHYRIIPCGDGMLKIEVCRNRLCSVSLYV